MSRWTKDEEIAIREIRHSLLAEMRPFRAEPDIVGDRKILRFLRSRNCNAQLAGEEYKKFLQWRSEEKLTIKSESGKDLTLTISDIRRKILSENLNHPSKFPFGEKALKILPEMFTPSDVTDRKGNPIVFAATSKQLDELLDMHANGELKVFVSFLNEFRMLVMEQMAETKEREYIEMHQDAGTRSPEYGVLIRLTLIRDLHGAGFGHFSAPARALLKDIADVAKAYYPESVAKNIFVNAPWLAYVTFHLVKGWFDERIISKVNILGADYLAGLLEEMDIEAVPESLGGKLSTEHKPFLFDMTPDSSPFIWGNTIESPHTLAQFAELDIAAASAATNDV